MSDASRQPDARAQPAFLKTYQQSEEIKERVEAHAREITLANSAFKVKLEECRVPDGVGEALKWGELIDDMLRKCLADLRLINSALTGEIAQRRRLEQQLSLSEAQSDKHRQMALHDSLTGLPNRALFNDRLHKALVQAKRHERSFAIMFMDIDAFKTINDVYGHHMGDKVLQMVACRLQACVRKEDTVARVGGDEFQVLLMEAKDQAAIAKIAKSMIARIADTSDLKDLSAPLKISIGIAISPRDGTTREVLSRNADAAMYQAKADGSGYHFLYSTAAENPIPFKDTTQNATLPQTAKTLHLPPHVSE